MAQVVTMLQTLEDKGTSQSSGRSRVCLGTRGKWHRLCSPFPHSTKCVFLLFSFLDRSSSIPGWPQVFYVARDVLDLLVFCISSTGMTGVERI